MKRRIIEINESRCNGCGLCASACHENAIGIVNGKAKLLRDDYCDGMGDCLPACPMDAIHFVEREAAAYDEAAVRANQAAMTEGEKLPHICSRSTAQTIEHVVTAMAEDPTALPCDCPGSAARAIKYEEDASCACQKKGPNFSASPGRLTNWPVQIQLAPISAPYFNGADLLIAADCTAYAYGAFHAHFIRDRSTVIGCPKLDGVNYAEKLAAILQSNDIRSVTLTRMLVPCCGGLEHMAKEALKNCGKNIPLEVVTIGMGGEIVRVERG